jgi:ribosomal protein S18 acetylase RimI-like enzyme
VTPAANLVVRRVGEVEWEALRDLRLSALAGAPLMFGTTLADAQRRDEAQWRDAARRGESGEGWVTFVAEEGGRLVGMASGALNEDGTAELLQMWVEPSARRRGSGAALCRAVIEWAAARSAPVVRLAVNATDPAAVALYRSVGFQDTGRRERDLFHGREALATIMERPGQPR